MSNVKICLDHHDSLYGRACSQEQGCQAWPSQKPAHHLSAPGEPQNHHRGFSLKISVPAVLGVEPKYSGGGVLTPSKDWVAGRIITPDWPTLRANLILSARSSRQALILAGRFCFQRQFQQRLRGTDHYPGRAAISCRKCATRIKRDCMKPSMSHGTATTCTPAVACGESRTSASNVTTDRRLATKNSRGRFVTNRPPMPGPTSHFPKIAPCSSRKTQILLNLVVLGHCTSWT